MPERASRTAYTLVLNHRANALSDRDLDQALEAELVDLGDAERSSFFSSLGTIARSVPAALPGMIQGAQTGAAAGPWGALAGGVAGGALHYAGPKKSVTVTPSRGNMPAAFSPAPAPSAATAPAPAPVSPTAGLSPTAQAPAPAQGPPPPLSGNASTAAAQLLRLIQDPRLLQACAALVSGGLGQREIQVNGTVAPPAAFLNLLSVLALEAAQEAPTGNPPVDGYLKGPDGAFVTDVASPWARARVLLERLQAAPAATPVEPAGAGAARPAVPASASAEAWLLESGLAELV